MSWSTNFAKVVFEDINRVLTIVIFTANKAYNVL